jgi:threonine dehydrogenase-like Zn-dependent dehydrogenase
MLLKPPVGFGLAYLPEGLTKNSTRRLPPRAPFRAWIGADSVLECVGTQESMMQAIARREKAGM